MSLSTQIIDASSRNSIASSSSSSRPAINRIANLAPLRINKSINLFSNGSRTSLSLDSNNSISPADLSPPVITNMPELKTIFNSISVQNSNDNKNLNNSIVNINNNINKNNTINNERVDNLLKNNSLIKIGNFILLEQINTSSIDSFNSAFNTETKQYFYWKKFDKKDFQKKLEVYMIMKHYNTIYNYKEMIFDEKFAYALFIPHHGDLHLYMKEKKKLEEPEAKFIFKQCVEAVNDCHMNGIVVRDIKLKKFVFLDQERTKVVLANLEDCLVLDEDAPNDLIRSQQGCPAYVSPEVLNPHPNACYSGRLSDSWSLGIILFTLLLGRYPFHHPTITVMFAKITRGKFQIPNNCGLSLDARLLLRSLIRSNPRERLFPFEILSHNWLKQIDFHNVLKSQNQIFLNSISNLTNNNEQLSNSILLKNWTHHKQQLGISLSAPSRIISSANTSFNNNDNINITNEPNNKRMKLNNLNNHNQDDCVVPGH